jgi:hypothetical protein
MKLKVLLFLLFPIFASAQRVVIGTGAGNNPVILPAFDDYGGKFVIWVGDMPIGKEILTLWIKDPQNVESIDFFLGSDFETKGGTFFVSEKNCIFSATVLNAKKGDKITVEYSINYKKA